MPPSDVSSRSSAGVSGLGVGGALTDRALIAGHRFDLIEANARAIVEAARG